MIAPAFNDLLRAVSNDKMSFVNADAEKVKAVFCVNQIRKKENTIIFGAKERGILCWMTIEEDHCFSLRVKTPLREIHYFPVNTSVQDTAVYLYNMLKFEPGKGVEIWYEEELKNLDLRPTVEKGSDDNKQRGKKGKNKRSRSG